MLEPLVDKTLTLLIQLPPYLSEKKGFTSFRTMTHHLDNRFRYALEVRHPSWFNENVYEFLKENHISLVWSVRDELKTIPKIISDQIYVRFIGDRSIHDKDFGKIVKDRKKELRDYIKLIKEIDNDANVRDIAVAFNNHYAGFGPQSVNDFLKMMDEPEIDWKNELEKNQQNNSINFSDAKYQISMSDFTEFTNATKWK